MAHDEEQPPLRDDEPIEPEESTESPDSRKLVRLLKPVVVLKNDAGTIDETIVSPRFFNAFNYSILSRGQSGVNVVVGVTSANRGEGKTVVASNLAVSLATVNERDTVLVDLNVAAPGLHRVFGVELSPGLTESLNDRVISVSKTSIPHLHVLPAGNLVSDPMLVDRFSATISGGETAAIPPSLGLEQVAEFRNIVYSLRQQFEFVVIDMPAIREPGVPLLLTHQMDGVLVVVDTNRTKKQDIERMFRSVHESRVLAFVFNRADADLAG